jgi:16S rRNA (cytosine1402-N4)-methyltransferase
MFTHKSVLIEEVKSVLLTVTSPQLIIDATLGLGWHTAMMLSHLTGDARLLGFDRDQENLHDATENIAAAWISERFVPIHASFADIGQVLDDGWYSGVDFVLYDLGVSSPHYDDWVRGFSVRYDGPLDMRFDRTTGRTAEDLVMKMDERELMQIFWRYADEKKALFIARAICEKRKTEKIDTTFKLLKIIEDASFDAKSPPRVFQALRIAVNDEFGHIERSIETVMRRIRVGGKIAVITFHSIEDRLVKNLFSEYTQDVIDDFTGQTRISAPFRKYTKKPIEPTEEEIMENPRSRSAKMRVLEKINPTL